MAGNKKLTEKNEGLSMPKNKFVFHPIHAVKELWNSLTPQGRDNVTLALSVGLGACIYKGIDYGYKSDLKIGSFRWSFRPNDSKDDFDED